MEFALILLVLALACGVAFAIVVLVTGDDPGLVQVTADGAPLDLPSDRPLSESDVLGTRFDTGMRGYRTTQVDDAVARLAYDVGFKDELIKVLASEVSALRGGRLEEADKLRSVRQQALGELDSADPVADEPAEPVEAGPGTEAGTGADSEGEAEAVEPEDIDPEIPPSPTTGPVKEMDDDVSPTEKQR